MDKVIHVVKEMMTQRSFSIEKENLDFSPSYILVNKNNGTYLLIILCLKNKLKKSFIQEYSDFAEGMNINHIIIIYKYTITSSAKSAAEDINDMIIELFTADELQYNITKHRLVPKHEKLEEDKAKELRKKLENKLPDISYKDPISRFYGFKRGDVIKITRKEDEYNYIIYRLVK